jgi:hypothetical protein
LYRQTGGIHSWHNAPSGTAGNAITFTQAMTLDASGNLGVGTTSPSSSFGFSRVLEISGTTAAFVINPSNTTSGGGIEVKGAAPLRFTTNNTEAARIDSSGNLLVGTTSNRGKFTLQGYPTSLPTSAIYRDNTDAQYVMVIRADTSVIGSGGTNLNIQFQDRNGGALGTITSSGTGAGSTAYNTSSDYRLKNTIAPMTGALAKVAQLKPVTYKWNPDNTDGQGFIAHELQEIFPEAVTGVKDEMETYTNDEGLVIERPRYQGIDTSFLVATLTAAMQEQQALITQLQADVAALKGAQA